MEKEGSSQFFSVLVPYYLLFVTFWGCGGQESSAFEQQTR
jgi:hypothetical protein